MNGILIIDKPKNFTSHDVVAKVKKVCKEKVGHIGTLDPNAVGVLPLLIGKATLISKYLINHDKEYKAVLKLGIKTNTADIEGSVIEEKELDLNYINANKIKNVLKGMIGKQEQLPPMYSAIKIKGKKLYEYAREEIDIEVKPRDIEIYNLELINYNNSDEITFYIKCSKGTYIRTVCENIAEKLKTVGYMKELQRISVGEFNIENAIKIDNLSKNIIEQNIITIEDFFKSKTNLEISDEQLRLFLNGVKLEKKEYKDNIYKIYNNSKFIGLGVIKYGLLKRDVVL